MDRFWNHEGDWDTVTCNVRRVSVSGGLTLCLVCGQIYFHAASCAPGPDLTRVSVLREKVGYSGGATSDDEKVSEQTRVTKLSFGHDHVTAFDLDHVALDVRDTMLLGFADTDVDGNLFSPGDRPTVGVEVVSAFSAPREAKLELELAVVREGDHTRCGWTLPWSTPISSRPPWAGLSGSTVCRWTQTGPARVCGTG